MRDFAKISPKIWIDEQSRKIKALGLEAQIVSFYLQTNPHADMIGIYYLPLSLASHEIGISIEKIKLAISQLCDISFCSYDHEYEYVWVHEMAKTQISSKLKAKDHRVKGVNDTFHSLPNLSFLGDFYEKYADIFLLEPREGYKTSLQGTCKPLASKENENEKDKDNEKEKEMAPDSPDAIPKRFFSLNDDCESSKQIKHRESAIEILKFLNLKAKKSFDPDIENLRNIIDRLMDGVGVDICRAVIANKSRLWLGNPTMVPHLNPVTLFKKENFVKYKGELVANQDDETNVRK